MSEQDVTIEELVREVIGECAGFVSLCWEPRPTGVFDSTLAADRVDLSVKRLVSALASERAAAASHALFKAREAVAGLAYEVFEDMPIEIEWVDREQVLAAIDALAAGQAPAAEVDHG